MEFIRNDGGQAASGIKGSGLCVTRAIAIALDIPFREVYDAICLELSGKKTPKAGVPVYIYADLLRELRCKYTKIGPRNRNYIYSNKKEAGYYDRADKGRLYETIKDAIYLPDLPPDLDLSKRYILELPAHLTVLIDGNIHDSWDCRGKRKTEGKRIVGYWEIPS